MPTNWEDAAKYFKNSTGILLKPYLSPGLNCENSDSTIYIFP